MACGDWRSGALLHLKNMFILILGPFKRDESQILCNSNHFLKKIK